MVSNLLVQFDVVAEEGPHSFLEDKPDLHTLWLLTSVTITLDHQAAGAIDFPDTLLQSCTKRRFLSVAVLRELLSQLEPNLREDEADAVGAGVGICPSRRPKQCLAEPAQA